MPATVALEVEAVTRKTLFGPKSFRSSAKNRGKERKQDHGFYYSVEMELNLKFRTIHTHPRPPIGQRRGTLDRNSEEETGKERGGYVPRLTSCGLLNRPVAGAFDEGASLAVAASVACYPRPNPGGWGSRGAVRRQP